MRAHFFLLLLGTGCGGSNPPPAPPAVSLPEAGVADATTAQQEDIAPMPYTAEQIHAGCPAGRTITFRIDVPGKPPMLHVLRFVTSTDEGADIESEDGKQHATWDELRHHAAFPKAATTIEDGVADTPAGKFPSKIYTVRKGDEVSKFYFANDRPGPPVLFFTEKNGARIRTSTLVPDEPAKVSCKTDDDCWIGDDGKAVTRPKEHRGKKLKPCKDAEHIPVCKENVCTVAAYKC